VSQSCFLVVKSSLAAVTTRPWLELPENSQTPPFSEVEWSQITAAMYYATIRGLDGVWKPCSDQS